MIDEAGLLPDMLRYDPSKPAEYPNGRALTDHVVAARLAMISNNSVPSDGLGPHDDLLGGVFPTRTPHQIHHCSTPPESNKGP